MSYLVLALGVLLSLCGAFAISAGYGIIQVERGWAGVIAGAAALSGGFVTIALGFILHSLSGLHGLLKTRKGLTPLPRELGDHEASELRPEPGLAFNPEASMVSEVGAPPPAAMPSAASSRIWPQRPARSNLAPARNALNSRGTVSPAARGTPESDFALPKFPPVSRAAPSGSPAMGPPSEPGFAMPAEVAGANAKDEAKTQPASAPAAEAPAEPPWTADDEPGLFDDHQAKERPIEAQLQETHIDPGEPETEPGQRATWPAETASIDATLGEDHFIEPDPALDARKEGTKPSPEAIEPASLTPAPPFEFEALPGAGPSEPSPPAAREAGLAIVGRYESEGTSYVMYADGSIEARSERGVFHFRSMAELKAFMEAQA
jgi:hypothetical protein